MGIRIGENKELIREIVREMILDGEIKITKISKEVYSNEGRHYGEEETLVLSVQKETEELDWDSEPIVKEVKQDYRDGLVLNEIEITGW